MAAPTAETKMRTLATHRSGRKVLAESARSWLDRAAKAAPMNAIQSVRCCTITVEPGMPGSRHCRETISVMGSSDISVRATAGTSRSSAGDFVAEGLIGFLNNEY